MTEKLRNSGYHTEELDKCNQRALSLDRDQIIDQHRKGSRLEKDNVMTFVINHDPSKDKCGGNGCLTCVIMNLNQWTPVRNMTIKLEYSLTCKSDNCIYIAICKDCVPSEFYIGQTINHLPVRLNNHRSCFMILGSKYEQSALSLYVFEKHIDKFEAKLNTLI